MQVDIEAELVRFLAADLGLRAVTELPADLANQATPGLLEVGSLGGPRVDVVTHEPRVDITCWATQRGDARALAYRVIDAVTLRFPFAHLTRGVVKSAELLTGPVLVPYDNTNVRRFHVEFAFRTRSA